MNTSRLFLILLFFGFYFPGSSLSQTARQESSQSFTLLYSSNVAGEYEPCG